MPVAKLYQHGLSMGTPPRRPNRNPPKRQSVKGWSAAACRRNTAFLRSVREGDLPGFGLTFTLTVGRCPPSPLEWHRLRKNYIDRLRRAGIHCLHWVTEWQRRKVPHLHGIVYLDPPADDGSFPRAMGRALAAWIEIAAPYGAKPSGQHMRVVTDVVGWLQYLGKHASRGVQHYQRSTDHVPPAWRGKTGRVWGHVGDWPVREPIALEFNQSAAWPLRRMVRAWRKADARAERDPFTRRKRIRSARGMLRCHDRAKSAVRGISEWIPPTVYDRMLEALHRDGHPIEHR